MLREDIAANLLHHRKHLRNQGLIRCYLKMRGGVFDELQRADCPVIQLLSTSKLVRDITGRTSNELEDANQQVDRCVGRRKQRYQIAIVFVSDLADDRLVSRLENRIARPRRGERHHLMNRNTEARMQ